MQSKLRSGLLCRVYLLVAIMKKRLKIEASLYTILQVLSVTHFRTNAIITGTYKDQITDDENDDRFD